MENSINSPVWVIRDLLSGKYFSLLGSAHFTDNLEIAQRFGSEADAVLCEEDHIHSDVAFLAYETRPIILVDSMHTNRDYKIADYRGYGEIVVPAGTSVTHMTSCGADPNYHFVSNFTWISKNYPQYHKMQLLFDAIHYGIDVPVTYVTL